MATRRVLLPFVAAALIVAGFAVPSRPTQDSPTRTLMRAKREYAHRLLDAVVQGEFDVTRDQAFRLKALAQTADWNVMNTAEYARFSDEFVHVAEELRAAAEREDGAEVLAAFVETVETCAACHQYVRTHELN